MQASTHLLPHEPLLVPSLTIQATAHHPIHGRTSPAWANLELSCSSLKPVSWEQSHRRSHQPHTELGGCREGVRETGFPWLPKDQKDDAKVPQHPWTLPHNHTTHQYSGMVGHPVRS